MSNPSGTDSGGSHQEGRSGGPRHAAAQPDLPEVDHDPVTEVIEIPTDSVAPATPPSDERRYTAPGFDAGSTQIIDRIPDDGELMTAATQAFPSSPRVRAVAPQAIGVPYAKDK